MPAIEYVKNRKSFRWYIIRYNTKEEGNSEQAQLL